jgi:hypothetical protein
MVLKTANNRKFVDGTKQLNTHLFYKLLDLMKKENIFPTVSRDQYYSSVFFHKRT